MLVEKDFHMGIEIYINDAGYTLILERAWSLAVNYLYSEDTLIGSIVGCYAA